MKITLTAILLLFPLFCLAMQPAKQDDFYEQLCCAIKKDDQVGVETLFKQPNSVWKIEYLLSNQKLDPNMRSEINVMSKGHALIHWAVRANNTDVLQVLLENKGIQVDIENANGCTALGFAIAQGRVQATSLLLNYDANPNVIADKNFYSECSDKYSFLHIAIMHYSQQISKQDDYYKVIGLLMLDEKTDPNIQDESGKTPLHCAVLCRSEKIVELLLHCSKTNKNILDKKCNTPLDYARQIRNVAIEGLLLNNRK